MIEHLVILNVLKYYFSPKYWLITAPFYIVEKTSIISPGFVDFSVLVGTLLTLFQQATYSMTSLFTLLPMAFLGGNGYDETTG